LITAVPEACLVIAAEYTRTFTTVSRTFAYVCGNVVMIGCGDSNTTIDTAGAETSRLIFVVVPTSGRLSSVTHTSPPGRMVCW
jgi:hypothetical protein